MSTSLHLSFSSTPNLLWHAYIKYLWNPHPSSWVTKVAYSFRVLAFLLILPVLVLTLLDITSYVIARTLGIVDDVKASTSDQPAVVAGDTPAILVEVTSSEGPSPAEQDHSRRHASPAHRSHNREISAVHGQMRPQAFFAGDEDLQLSSIGVFSPSPSQPSSPVLPENKLSGEGGLVKVEDVPDPRDGDVILRRRPQGSQTTNNS